MHMSNHRKRDGDPQDENGLFKGFNDSAEDHFSGSSDVGNQSHSAEEIHAVESDEEFRQLINAKGQTIISTHKGRRPMGTSGYQNLQLDKHSSRSHRSSTRMP